MSSLQDITRICYEIALEIGGTMNLQAMLERSIHTLLRNIDCKAAAVFADRQDNGQCWLEEIIVMPRTFRDDAAYAEAVHDLPTSQLPGTGRTHWPDPRTRHIGEFHCYFLDLAAYGVLILFMEQPMESALAKALAPICKKLGDACRACSAISSNHYDNLASVFNAIAEGVISMDSDGTVISMNPVAQNLTGWTVKEALGEPLATVFNTVGSGKSQSVIERVKKVIETGLNAAPANHKRLVARDGIEYLITDSIAPIRDNYGNVIGAVLIFRDVTEQYRTKFALQASAQRFRTTIESIPMGMHFYQLKKDNQLIFTGANPAADIILRVDHDLFIGKPIEKAFPSLVSTPIPNIYRKLADTGGSWKTEQVDYEDGEIKGAFEVLAFQTEPYKMVAMFTDITSRKKADEALLESEEKYRILFESSVVGLGISDPSGNVIAMNNAMFKITGYTFDEFSKMKLVTIYANPEDRAQLLHELERQGVVEHFEVRMIRKTGDTYWASLSCNPIKYNGEDAFIVSLLDITKRKEAESERERLMSAIEQISEAIFIADAEGTIQYVNPAFEIITGYKRHEVLGKSSRIPKSDAHDDAYLRNIWDRLLSGTPWSGQFINQKKDGARYTVDSAISPVRDTSGRIVNYVAVMRNVTEKLELEEQLRQAQKVEAIGRLAGGVAHDLNNMLSPILGYSELLRDELATDSPLLEYVDEIINAGIKARDLVRQLLAFSRKQTLEYKPVHMNNAVKDFEKLLRRTIRENIEIEIVTSPQIPLVKADMGQIEQVIINLAVNAADAMPKGGKLTIKTAPFTVKTDEAVLHQDLKPGTYVILTVRDTGCGMDPHTQEHLFEPFFSTKGEQGTGLGLATVYGIIKQHGGALKFHSTPGSGTTFDIYLPATETPNAEKAYPEDKITSLYGSETILLVEDNAQTRHLAHTILKQQGYTVLLAEDGKEALNVMGRYGGQVHLLLTDVILPEINGKELFAKISKDYPHLRVLYMSGYTDNVIAHHGVLERGIAFIQKPFRVKALAAKVREVLDRA